MGNKNYLTEQNLGTFLNLNPFFYDQECHWIHDKIVPDSGIRSRPDYRCEKLKLIVEFDGYQHYTVASNILIDHKKDEVYSKMGYSIIRIPYFVQLEPRTIKFLFGFENDYPQDYPHGFVDKKAILPADFCELGIDRFKSDLERFSFIKSEIIQSLKTKVAELLTLELVLPNSLNYIFT